MALLRYKTKDLFDRGRECDPCRMANSRLNREEAERGEPLPRSFPRRVVLEVTNACNLNCVMCGRVDADFRATYFDMNWLRRLEPILSKVEEVTLMGWGEPTIHPDFAEMLHIIRGHGARIYFCTNGMTLRRFKDDIFSNMVDVIAVSLDGSTPERNQAIRRGSDFDLITGGISDITAERARRGVPYPYLNFVTTLMADNFRDFPNIVKLAASLGMEEAKAVYLTAFSERMGGETLWDRVDEVEEAFNRALEIGGRLNVDIKLPHIQGRDPAGTACHQTCLVAWRDFFIGSDGYVRPCMSTALKFFHIDEFNDFQSMWRHAKYVDFRNTVNVDGRMDANCARCYQSSHANWNRRDAFIHAGGAFSPDWES